MAAIVFENVCKSFPRHRGQILLRDRVVHVFRKSHGDRFQALTDITFSVDHGESVALVGHNGAGKSTLLSLAAGVARVDSGSLQIEGQVAPMLELGAGFHPDLTGAENIWINAALMGMSKREAARWFDTIIEFSGVGEFIYEPLRTYSAGMNVRLAFSVAINTDPDVLVIDEVLGAGDAQFFQKCLEKILDFRRAGKTILCASHAGELLKKLCDRAVWLDHGHLKAIGDIDDVLAAYKAG